MSNLPYRTTIGSDDLPSTSRVEALPRQELLVGQPNLDRGGDSHVVLVAHREDVVGDAHDDGPSLLAVFHARYQFSRFRQLLGRDGLCQLLASRSASTSVNTILNTEVGLPASTDSETGNGVQFSPERWCVGRCKLPGRVLQSFQGRF